MQKSQANLFIVLTGRDRESERETEKESGKEWKNLRAPQRTSGYAILHIIRIIKMKNNMKSETKKRVRNEQKTSISTLNGAYKPIQPYFPEF